MCQFSRVTQADLEQSSPCPSSVINCGAVSGARAYSEIWTRISGGGLKKKQRRASSVAGLSIVVERSFSAAVSRRQPGVLVVDEYEMLML